VSLPARARVNRRLAPILPSTISSSTVHHAAQAVVSMLQWVADMAPRAVARRAGAWWPDALAVCAIGLLFCLRLFVGLGDRDLENDEAIYAYAIDRMLDTGDWLTPRSIPSDNSFLEKPPLKFWMVAAPMRAGMLPHDEVGFRFVDALAGATAFLYVFLLGRRLAGPLCGFIAVLVLFTQWQFVFVHGLRSNNMESTLLLCYCGGVFHFARWVDGMSARARKRDALGVAGYFALGFMTKFVAAFFLPLVCLLALAWRSDGRHIARARWREWIVPTLVVAVVTVPWFVYQTVESGVGLWRVMAGQHVVTRFTGALDPRHLRPWNFYLTEEWGELYRSGSRSIVVAGLCATVFAAWHGRPWLARVLILWSVVPVLIISAGTSKIFHYAYPFLPPLALGAGFIAAVSLQKIVGVLATAGRPGDASHRLVEEFRRVPRGWRHGAILLGALAFCAAAWTAVTGGFEVDAGGVRILKNSSVLRPTLVMAMLWAAAGRTALAVRAALALAFIAVLPWHAYGLTLTYLHASNHPLRALRDCARSVQALDQHAVSGVYNAATATQSHSYFYYLRAVGPWQAARPDQPHELQRRLVDPNAQTPVIMSVGDYDVWRLGRGLSDVLHVTGRQPSGVAPDPSVIILLPGPYEACVAPAVTAGGRPVGGNPGVIGEAHEGR
jgi:4-amino-4-deoxy-L-arabinose transferase-like glycosyltransferase